MEASELCYTSLRGLATLIQRQEVSPVEATQAVVDRVEKFDRQLNSFITLLRDEALTQAHAAEQESSRVVTAAPCMASPSPSRTCFTPRVSGRPRARRSSSTSSQRTMPR